MHVMILPAVPGGSSREGDGGGSCWLSTLIGDEGGMERGYPCSLSHMVVEGGVERNSCSCPSLFGVDMGRWEAWLITEASSSVVNVIER